MQPGSPFLSSCSSGSISLAAQKMKAGSLVAFPTETVYGLGADASSAAALAQIYAAKGRPADHPLIVHIGGIEKVESWARDIPEYAIALARDFWPGPLTLVLLRSPAAGDFITGGQDTVALRVPAHAVALALLKAFHDLGGLGIAAPSANRFGQLSPTTAQAVAEEIGAFLSPGDLILDGGSALVGIESTIVDCTSIAPRILRPGAITAEMIEESTGLILASAIDSEIRVSGSLENHYSPKGEVILGALAEVGEGFIALANIPTPKGAIRLAAPTDTQEYARLLYAALRFADSQGIKRIAVLAPEGGGIAIAIRDRLMRAAQKSG